MAPSYGRRGGGSARNSNSNKQSSRPSRPSPSVAPPLHDEQYILSAYAAATGGRAKPNPKHLENPKGVLANYVTALGEKATYKGGKANVAGVEGYR